MSTLLEIRDLSVEYRTGEGVGKSVNNLNLKIEKGEAVGLVGESGAGKTTTALSILNLLPPKVGFVTGGDIEFNGKSVFKMKEQELNDIRGNNISMIFANPLTSLNPVFTVGHQIAMVAKRHLKMSDIEAKEEAKKLLRLVGIPDYRINEYPHQFSGGMRQRVGIAAALVCNPELLIADEPTTALDVTIQAQILKLMTELQSVYNTSLLMITHNLGIISEMCQKVAVMYAGEIIEYGTVKEVYAHPMHPYTVGLFNAVPKLKGPRKELVSIPGHVANSKNLPSGCRFHVRCDKCEGQCSQNHPAMIKVNEDHYVACWAVER